MAPPAWDLAWQWWWLLLVVLTPAFTSWGTAGGNLGARRLLGQQQQFGQDSWWRHFKLVVDAEIVKCQDRKIGPVFGYFLSTKGIFNEHKQTLETPAFQLTTVTHKISDCIYGWLHLEKMLVGVHTNSQELLIQTSYVLRIHGNNQSYTCWQWSCTKIKETQFCWESNSSTLAPTPLL